MKRWLLTKSLVNNERGLALVMVLLVLTVFTVLGMTLFSLSLNNLKMSSQDRNYESVYYIAEAGSSSALKKLDQIALDAKKETEKLEDGDQDEEEFISAFEARVFSGNVTYPSPDFEEVYGEKPVATTTVTKVAKGLYKVTSIGKVGRQSRTVEQFFQLGWQPSDKLTNFAVFSKTVTIGQGGDIEGNTGVTSMVTPSVQLKNGSPSISGSIYVPKGTETTAIIGSSKEPVPYEGTVSTKLPPFPVFPAHEYADPKQISLTSQSDTYTLNVNKNLSFTDISVKGGTLTIHIGDSEREIVVDNLSLGSGTINIVPTGPQKSGTLKIYIRNSFSLTQSNKINFNKNEPADVKKLTMFLKASEAAHTVELGSGTKIHGSFYAEKANLEIGGGSSFEGHVVTGGQSVKVNGGANVYQSLFYAPNARFEVTGSADIRGLVVADALHMTGGWIRTRPIDYTTVPFAVPTIGVLIPYDKGSLLSKQPAREAN